MLNKTPRLVTGALALAGLLVLPGPSAAAQVVTTTFDTDLEGWTAVGFDINPAGILSGTALSVVDNSLDIVHDSGGDSDPLFTGNGGGFARFTDVIVDPGSFASASSAYLGDLSAFAGGTFSFDHRLFDEGSDATSVAPYVIVFISGDPNNLAAYGAVFPGPDINDADTDWVNLSVNLTDGGPNGLLPISQIDLGIFDDSLAGDTIESLSFGFISTTASLQEVLGNVTQVLVSFELVDNNSSQVSEAGGIDNPTLRAIPEPASAALIGLAGACCLLRRRA